MLKSLIQKIVPVRDEELKAMLIATAYGFFIMFSYYIMRPVRDEISAADRGNLQILWTVVFFAMLVAVPAYSWVAARLKRVIFVPLVNRFFIACLVGFWFLLVTFPDWAVWIDRGFYVWLSVFNLFVVAVFWSFVVDCFENEQGKRIFGFIAMGSSLGGLAGSGLTAALAASVPVFTLLLIACVPLELASWAAKALDKASMVANEDVTLVKEKPLAGTAFAGFKTVFQSRYLMGIAGFFLFMTFCSTILYYQQSFIVGEQIADSGERTTLFAQMDMAVNLLTFFFQIYLSAKIMKWVGVGVALAAIPAAVFIGFGAMGLYPTLAAIVIVQVLYRAGRYGITRPAREVLYTVVSREEKYKAKAFIDAAVYRGGDLVSGWMYAGMAALGLSIGAIALVSAPIAALWVMLGLSLGGQQEERREEGWEGVAAPAEVASGD